MDAIYIDMFSAKDKFSTGISECVILYLVIGMGTGYHEEDKKNAKQNSFI